jgi:Fe-S oxidoreductase
VATIEHLYDPLQPSYWDEGDARAERDRTFQICSDCRICVKFCPSFKDLFRMIDENEDAEDVSVLTDDQHKQVVDECYQCKLCYVACPYTPDQQQEWKIDFPRLMLRSLALQAKKGEVQRGARLLARTDLQGKFASAMSGFVNKTNDVKPVRFLMEKSTGIARNRLLPNYAKVRFSKWFAKRDQVLLDSPASRTVALFPTCLVEYQEPDIGKATVKVCERNGIACDVPDGQVCCGMPWLDAGDVAKFEEAAKTNVAKLVDAVKGGADVLVPQPTCGYVVKNEYPDFLGTDDARLVAEHTYDVAEYLMARNREQPLDTEFSGTTYATITWHAACHYRAQQIGPKSRDLMALTGAKVELVERCSAIDGTWGLRAENVEMAHKIAKPLMERVEEAESELVTGDCHLANTAIREATGKVPVHPVQVLARAYGLDDDEQ